MGLQLHFSIMMVDTTVRILTRIVAILTIVSLVESSSQVETKESSTRHKRVFSLFNVVTFDNMLCQGTNKGALDVGTCFTAEECGDKGGTSIGNCASGFGVCCQFTASTCGSDVKENCTFVQNDGFPASFMQAAACQYNVQNQNSIICQLRLDFITFMMTKTAGACVNSLVIDGPTRRDPTPLCGNLMNQHIYVETGRSVTATTLTFNPTMAASWRIKVSYIECNNPRRGPEGCLQYFTGASGEFTSFSFNDMDTSLLLDTDYTVCIRRENGFCSIDYSVQETGTGMEFQLGMANAQPGMALATNEAAFLTIPGSKNIFYSGTILSEAAGDTKNSVVSSTNPSFRVNVFSTKQAVPANAAKGFFLSYNQKACT